MTPSPCVWEEEGRPGVKQPPVDPTSPYSDGSGARRATILTGVSHQFTAWHTDRIGNEGRHQHTWDVTAWFNGRPAIDARCQKEALRRVLGVWEGTDMPPELWSAEAFGEALMGLLPSCIGVNIDRPGYHAEIRA